MSKIISGTITTGYTLSGAADTPFTLTASGSLSGLVALYGDSSEQWDITNAGIIAGNTISTSGTGVRLQAGGVVTNQSTGTISGSTAVSAATVVNYGIIKGNSTAGTGIYLAAGGDATNHSGGTVSGQYGIKAAGAATVVNAGRITGSASAVLFRPGYTNRLIVDPGATFSGLVNGGNTIGSTHVSTLELASGASAGTLSGLGAQFINFEQTTIDAGATWSFTGTNTLAAGDTLRNSGTLSDAGTLVNAGTLINSGRIVNGTATGSAIVSSGNAADFVNDGSVLVASGTMTIDGSVTGYGALDIGSHGTLVLGSSAAVSAEQTIEFLDATGTVDIASTTLGAVAATITGFTTGDAIDLTGIQAVSYTFNPRNGVLSLFDAADALVATLEVGGDFGGNANAFHLTSDDGTGTLITSQAIWYWNGGSGDFYSANWAATVPVGSETAPQAGDQANIVTSGADVDITAADAANHGALDNLFIGIGSTIAAQPATFASEGQSFGSATVLNAYRSINSAASFGAITFKGPTDFGGTIYDFGGLTLSDIDSLVTGAGDLTLTDTAALYVVGTTTSPTFLSPTISGVLTNDGGIVVDQYATLQLSGDVQGNGLELIAFNGTVEITTGTTIGTGQKIDFYDNTNTLKIDGTTTANFGATITDFTSGDTIDLAGIKSDSVSYDPLSGLVSLFETGITAPVATLHFPVGEADINLHVTGDSGGTGTLLTTLRAAGDGGDVALQAGLTRNTYNVDGTGIKIGILSDSFNLKGLMQTDINNGDLPADTTVVQDFTSGEDEGRAMAELVHRIAPGAQIYYYTAYDTEASFATGINTLAALGCNIIVDDVTYLEEPFYQDAGPITAAVENAVQSGVNYFTSAANFDSQFYEQDFAPIAATLPGSAATMYNDFGGDNAWQSLTLPLNAEFRTVLQWSQPFALNGNAGATGTLGLLLYDANGNLVASSTASAIGSDPIQYIDYTNTTGSTAFRLAVDLVDGTAPSQFKYTLYDSGFVDQANAYVGSGTVQGHEKATGANVVGAVPYYQTPAFAVSPPVLEPFSSTGPGLTLFDSNGNPVTPTTDNEPTFASVDGVQTDVFKPFFGTSAAAPDAAAVAALMLQANSSLDPGDVTNLLKDSAVVISLPSPNSSDGAGLIQADRAVGFAQTGTITFETDGNTTLWGTHLNDVFVGGDNTETFLLDGGSDIVRVPAAAALADDTIDQFTTDDSIRLLNLSATHATLSGDVLNVTDSGPTVVASFTLPGVAAGTHFHVAQSGGDSIVTTACYCRGTHILTPSGEIPVEALEIGDEVITLSGEAKPIKWIGRRSYGARFIAGNRNSLPIRIVANALADGVPNCDLDVSPKHAMFLDGVLVPAEKLVNGISIYQLETVDSVEYFHLELQAHDVIFAAGAPAETFCDCDNRFMFQNAAEFGELYPDADAPAWQFCAPRVDDGDVLRLVRQALGDRVERFGHTTTFDPDLRPVSHQSMC